MNQKNLNPIINKALKVLKSGGLILYPSDAYWSIGCDATNSEALKRVYTLKKQIIETHITCLVSDDRMLKKYVAQIPEVALNIIDVTDRPTTIIFDEAKNLSSDIISKDGSIAIRIPDDDFCYWLTRKLNGTITCFTANINGLPIPKSFKEINPEVLKGVDYVVNLHHEKIYSKPLSIIKLSNSGVVKVIR